MPSSLRFIRHDVTEPFFCECEALAEVCWVIVVPHKVMGVTLRERVGTPSLSESCPGGFFLGFDAKKPFRVCQPNERLTCLATRAFFGNFSRAVFLTKHQGLPLRWSGLALRLRSAKDMIYNMACPASPVHYQWNPIKTTKAGNPL